LPVGDKGAGGATIDMELEHIWSCVVADGVELTSRHQGALEVEFGNDDAFSPF